MDIIRGLRRIALRVRATLLRRRVEREIDEEYQFHLDQQSEAEMARGLTREAARTAALRAMDGLLQHKERSRLVRGLGPGDALSRHLRDAVRTLRRDPGTTGVAVICLALAIGSGTAVLGVIDAVLLEPLPVPHPEQIYVLRHRVVQGGELSYASSGDSLTLSLSALERLRERPRTLVGVFGRAPLTLDAENVAMTAAGQTDIGGGEMVTGGYFATLGVVPAVGRALADADEQPGAPRVAVISDRYWARRFGRDPSVVGTSLTLNREAFTVVGVAPAGFLGIDPGKAPDVWVPFGDYAGLTPWGVQPNGGSIRADRRWWWIHIGVRVRPDVPDAQVRAELDLLFRQSLSTSVYAAMRADRPPRIEMIPLRRGLGTLRSRFSTTLWLLLGTIGLVLLIACANVATLLLARGSSRVHEMGIRLAIGAPRGGLVRQLLTESLLLAASGWLLGVVAAVWAGPALLRLMVGPTTPVAINVRPDGGVLLVSAAAALLTAVLFGLAPALRSTKVDVARLLVSGGSRVVGRRGPTRILVAAQIAILLPLLVGAGLLTRTVANLRGIDVGFDRRNLLVFSLDARRTGVAPTAVWATYQAALERIHAVPGVLGVTASSLALLTGWTNNGPITSDVPASDAAPSAQAHFNLVGPEFARTMGIDVVAGRDISWDDIRNVRKVALINETMARRLFRSGSPMGRRFNFGNQARPAEQFEIVGLVRDAKFASLTDQPPGTVYVPFVAASDPPPLYFEVRTASAPDVLAPVVQRALGEIDRELLMRDVKTEEQQIDEQLAGERVFAELSRLLGGLALLLVLAGLYGTMAYAVAGRTNELGIRITLGARSAQIVRMVLGQAAVTVVAGVGLGLPGTWWATRLIRNLLYGVDRSDPWTLGSVVLILLAVGAAAAAIPARHAASLSPTTTLRRQ